MNHTTLGSKEIKKNIKRVGLSGTWDASSREMQPDWYSTRAALRDRGFEV